MSTRIDLDDLGRKARSADPELWIKLSSDADTPDRWEDELSRASGQHIAANSPPVTLALVARIRELETTLSSAATLIEGIAQTQSQHPDYHDDLDWKTAQAMRRIVDKGTVLL